MTYILILFVAVGGFGDKGTALTSIMGFTDQSQCQAAGKIATQEFGKGTNRASFICVAQKR